MRTLTTEKKTAFIGILKARFEKHMNRHPDIKWSGIQTKLETNSTKLWSLNELEASGGEPDVVGYDQSSDEYLFFDCSEESPKGRRSLCYDNDALKARKEHKPAGSAVEMAGSMGAVLLTEAQYRSLQKLGNFDLKTSSWVKTPPEIRDLGGALFCDCRYNAVFLYHNGADSYYAARGFRCALSL